MSSALGVALGMTSTYTWTQVVSALTGVATKTSGSQSVTTSGKWGFDKSYGPWLYIPTNGYYKTSHWLNIPWNTIKSSLGTANTGNVLSGYTFTSQNGIKLSGSMANRSSTIQTATTDTSNQSKSCYRINGSNIEVVPAVGYWGNWNWNASCIRVPTSVSIGALSWSVLTYKSTFGINASNPSGVISNGNIGSNSGFIIALSFIANSPGTRPSVSGGTTVLAYANGQIGITVNRLAANESFSVSVSAVGSSVSTMYTVFKAV